MRNRINKRMYIAVVLLVFIACNSNKKQDTSINLSVIDSILSGEKENLNTALNTLPIHGKINRDKLVRYYPGITDTIKYLGVLSSEKVNLNPANGVVVSLLQNTETYNQLILCTHNKNFELIDNLYIGKATDFDNGKSHTINYSVISSNEITFDQVDWGYVKKDNEEEIDTVKYERWNIRINNKGIINTVKEPEINIQNLQESFIAKDETKFLNQFPKNFKQFHKYFGWDSVNDEPEKLYHECYDYINYWFDLLSKEKYKEHEKNIIKVCINGKWEADGVNYFQDKSINYIKEKQKYHLINELIDTEAKSVLFFLFDSPHPQFDADFEAYLNISKKKILKELFETDFSDENENIDIPQTDDISYYSNNDSYFIKDIDINNDAVLDKVVSSKRYEGDELLLFINNNNTYKLALKTINFSEDGGNQIIDIKKDENGFVVITSFPDRGFFESHFFISFNNDRWILTNTIYKTESSNQEDAFIYICDVKQNIDMNDSASFEKLKSMPDESDRDKTCLKQNKPTIATIDSVSVNQMKDAIEDELLSIFDYYKQEVVETHGAWSTKLFGRCCSNTDLTFSENLFFKISANYSNKKYPIKNVSDSQYLTAFVFKPNSKVKINVQLDLEKSYFDGKYSNKNLFKHDEIIMNPIKLSLINGYVKSKPLFYKNARVKELRVSVNNQFIQSVILKDTPLVQEFKIQAVFKSNDIITLEPATYYKGTEYDDVCISEIQTNLGETALYSLNKKYNLMELINKR